MRSSLGNQRGNTVLIIVVGVLLVVLVDRHPDRCTSRRSATTVLPFDVDAAYPPDKTLVGGEAFASTAAAIMDHELHGGTGWRPNDFILWGPAIGRRQQRQPPARHHPGAARERARVQGPPDQDLVERVRPQPGRGRRPASATTRPSSGCRRRRAVLRGGVEALNRYVAGLEKTPPTSQAAQPAQRRADPSVPEPGPTCSATRTPTCSRSASRTAAASPIWHTDDYFYHAQGMAHVMYHLGRALQREYADRARQPAAPVQVLDEVIDALGRAAVLKPLIVLDGGPDGPVRQPSPQPRRLHRRRAAEDVHDPRGAGEVAAS